MPMTREQAWDLLTTYNKEPFHLRHAVTVERVMGWYARELGYGEEAGFWSIVGLLHDLDFEQWPEEHCVKSQELMRQVGVEESVIRPPPATAGGSGWTSSRSTRWKRSSTPATSSLASSERRPSCGPPGAWRTWS